MSIARSERAHFEAALTFWRIVELEFIPVVGDFDASHLCEINRRIFQDLPGKGFDDVTPGKYRPEVREGTSWLKSRKLETNDARLFVAYSGMTAKAQRRMEAALAAAQPAQLRQLDTPTFISAMAMLYAELDYAHPFPDGNSRTIRAFTKQLAHEAGFDLDWSGFNATPALRDGLYAARDNAVNRLALPRIEHEHAMRKIISSMEALKTYPNMHKLLSGAIRLA